MKTLSKETMALFSKIPTGYNNAMYVPNENCSFRRAVKVANCKGDLIINIGTGYFRPDLNDKKDVELVNRYLEKERARAVKTLFKLGKMQKTVNAKDYEWTMKEEVINGKEH